MVARSLEELVVYQLGTELREIVYALSDHPSVVRDFKFRDQFRDAASSICRNTAEGFGRFRHKEFANFLVIARGSAYEIRDLLDDGVVRRYWSSDDTANARSLCKRTSAAQTRLIIWLRTHPDP